MDKRVSSIGKARRKRAISQGQLAEAVGVTLATIHRIEHGKNEPRISIALDVADALGEDTSRLRALFDLPKTDRKGGAQ